MVVCASCATENAPGSRFCNGCGSPLTASPAPIPEERKVVSALFCDLVGFTATSEGADPEDVDRMLTAYFAMARAQIEAHGGVVEKFIGDAVLGVFGVPAAHEDDPERAVRAALRITEEADRLTSLAGAPLRLRVGINTGEVHVRLGVDPGSGERFLAGDAINTAARIQSVAPEMGVGVGLATYQATKAVFEFDELPPASLKGKAEPVRVFHATTPRARLGIDLSLTHASAYVGREIDLALLNGLFDECVAASSVQLVTVVGEPGIGKSRIVAELLDHAQGRVPGLTWRQGRCLPYGDGVTFWALGEIVKAYAGILETDDPASVLAKIDDAVPAGPDRDWLRQRLMPLVGVDASSTAEREELFAAWRTFLQDVAESHPTVLVFEDIHWADDAMLAFLEYLADRTAGVPLIVVATARPELFERHPSFASSLPNVNRISLAPLSDIDTAQLVTRLLGAVAPPELQGSILERAAGNPLYAEEYVRLLTDRELLLETNGAVVLRPGVVLPLPESIGALIAARLDTLPSDRKAMLADAAVMGKVFWAGAVAAMGERDLGEVIAALGELARKDFVRLSRQSSMAGETEYAFWHVLTRDVAYAQLPRASRAARHVAAAQWLEAKAGERVEDIAEVLAHHWATALELARAAGQTERAVSLEPTALRFLTLAGEKTMQLDVATAATSFERALALAPAGHPARARMLVLFGEVLENAGRHTEASGAFREAIESFRARGDLPAAADAIMRRGSTLGSLGDARGFDLHREALATLEPLAPGPGLVAALGVVSIDEILQGRSDAGLDLAERAVALSVELGLEPSPKVLTALGLARCSLGDRRGVDDLRQAVVLATRAGQGHRVTNGLNNLAAVLFDLEGPKAALQTLREGIAFGQARGLADSVHLMTSGSLDCLFDLGQLDEALDIVAGLAARLTEIEDAFSLLGAQFTKARIMTLRGLALDVGDALDVTETLARGSEDPQALLLGLWGAALVRQGLGQDDEVALLLTEIEAYPGARATSYYRAVLPAMVRTALGLGEPALAERLVSGLQPPYPLAEHAVVAAGAAITEARGDLQAAAHAYADAADRWESFGVVPEQGFALLGQGRCLLGLSRPTEAAPVLKHAHETFERLKAAPAVAETDALLQQATALGS